MGVRLCNHLLGMGHEVIGVHHQNTQNIPAGVTSYASHELITAAIRPDLIYVLGAYVPYQTFNNPDDRFYTLNIKPVMELTHAYPAARFIIASSVAVYGSARENITENTPGTDISLYGLSKLFAEGIIRQTTSWAILRFSSVYGSCFNPVNYINRAIAQAQHAAVINVFGDGSRKQDYIHVNDAVQLLERAAQLPTNEVLLGASGISYSNKHVAELIAAECPGSKIHYTGQDNSPSYYYNPDLTLKLLNFKPVFSLEKGIKECLGI